MKTQNLKLIGALGALFFSGFSFAQVDSSLERKSTVIDGKNLKITIDTKIGNESSKTPTIILDGDTVLGEVRETEISMNDKSSSKNDNDDSYERNNREWFNFDLGFNFLTNNGTLDMPEAYKDLELENGKGCNFNLRIYEQSIDLVEKHLYLMYGAGIDWNNYRFKNNVDLLKDSSTLAYTINNSVNYSKNKLVSSYLTVPIMLKIRMKENEDGDAFQICFGPQFGYLLNSHLKQKWEKDGDKNKQKTRGDYNLNEFRIGYQLYFGYKNIQFYARYYPESAFKTNKGPDVNTMSLGLALGGYN
jgi:hypothetical protein